VQGIFIKGIMTDTIIDGKKFINTIYSLSIEGITLCVLGPIADANLSSAVRGQIDTPDIVFIPIGGAGTISPAEAYKLATTLDAKVIIPMDFDEKLLKAFLKEGGQDNTKPEEKLTIKAKELAGREGEIIVLQS
jgi:L-ascorbate metabolism protein UlaG (beta-lactamase superfamily)